jgi:hypothetical protein
MGYLDAVLLISEYRTKDLERSTPPELQPQLPTLVLSRRREYGHISSANSNDATRKT